MSSAEVAPTARKSSLEGPSLAVLLLLGSFLFISGMWAVFIPLPLEGVGEWWGNYHPDEHNHIRVIVYVATHHRLPPFTGTPPENFYTSIHPPLYHIAAAVVYSLLAPLIGHAGVLLTLRFVSCALGMGTVWLTYRTARYLLPHAAALTAAAVVAGVPMFVSLSAAVTNENLAAFTAAGALWMMVAGLRHGFDRRRLIKLSVWVAAGIASKITCLGLLPAAALALFWSGRRRSEPLSAALRKLVIVVAVSAVVSGWWFVRNQMLYGDPFRTEAQLRMWQDTSGRTTPRMTTGQFFWNTTVFGWNSFWGVFDGFTRPLPQDVYRVILLVEIAAVAGLFLAWRRGNIQGIRLQAAGVMALFAVLVQALFYAYNKLVFGPQGRYLFPLLVPLGIALALGWRSLFPARFRGIASGALMTALFLLNVFALIFMSVRPDSAVKPPGADHPGSALQIPLE